MESAKVNAFDLTAAQKAQLTKEANRLQKKRTSTVMEAGAVLCDASHIRAADACAALLKERPALFTYMVKDLIETGVLQQTLASSGEDEEGAANEYFRQGCTRFWQIPLKHQEKILKRLSPVWYQAYEAEEDGLPPMLPLIMYSLHVSPSSWLPSHFDKKFGSVQAFLELCDHRYMKMGSRLHKGPSAGIDLQYWEKRDNPPQLVFKVRDTEQAVRVKACDPEWPADAVILHADRMSATLQVSSRWISQPCLKIFLELATSLSDELRAVLIDEETEWEIPSEEVPAEEPSVEKHVQVPAAAAAAADALMISKQKRKGSATQTVSMKRKSSLENVFKCLSGDGSSRASKS
eukprot:4000748-Amphidinium_carterae.1